VIRVATTVTPAAVARSCGRAATRCPRVGITRLLVEGGARVASSFVAASLVDEVWLLRGPDAVGTDGIAALDALPLTAITQSPAFNRSASETLPKGHSDHLRARLMFTGIVTDIGEIVSLTPNRRRGSCTGLRIACRYGPRHHRGRRFDRLQAAFASRLVASGVEGGKNLVRCRCRPPKRLGMTTAKHWIAGTKLNLERALKNRRRTRRPYRRRTLPTASPPSSSVDDLPDNGAVYNCEPRAKLARFHRRQGAR